MSRPAGSLFFVALLVLGPVAAGAAESQPFRLGLRIDTPATTPPGGIAVAHLDEDGKLDVVVANPAQATVSVRRA